MTLSKQALTTVVSVKTYIGLDLEDDTQDEAIEQLISSASAYIAGKCNRVFGKVTATEKLTGSGRQKILLNNYPITEVTAVVVDGITLIASEYEILSEEGELLRIESNWPAPGRNNPVYYPFPPETALRTDNGEKRNISVSYTAGYVLPWQENLTATPIVESTLPYDLEMACIKMVAADINRKGSEHEKSEGLGPLQSAFLDNDYMQSVLETIERYKKPVIT